VGPRAPPSNNKPEGPREKLTAPELRQLSALIDAGVPAELERKTRELLERSPGVGLLWKVLGAALRLQGKDALQPLRRATELLPGDAEAHRNFANTLHELRRLDEAVVSYRRAIAIRPDYASAHHELGNALAALGRPADAVGSYRQALQFKPDFAEADNDLGNALQALGHPEDALASYRRALALKPDFAAAHLNLGTALQSLARLDDAVASYGQALEIAPVFPEAHNNLGNALRQLGRLDDAVVSYRRALEIKHDYAEAHNNLGNALRGLGRPDDAAASYRRALQIMPHSAEAHNNLGNVLLDLKQVAEAASSYRLALQFRPDYAEAHSNLGAALLELGELEAAVASCRRAFEIGPGHAEAHNNLGNALRGLGRLAEAEASYRRALEIKVDYAKAHGNLGGVLRLQGRLSEAEASCRTALEIDPNQASTLALMAEFRADKGEFEKAHDLLERAISIEPDFPQAWAGLARWRTMTRDDAAWLTGAQRVAGQRLPPHKEVFLRYAIGKYFDDVKDFKEAFASYRRANELEKLNKPRHDGAFLTQAVDVLTQTYDRAWLTRTRTQTVASERPIFIVGMPRSGTTLAEQILASHPAVFGAGELPFWDTAMATYEAAVLRGETSDSIAGRLSNDYLRLLKALSPDAVRVVDKMPGNFMFLGLMHAALPHARIIHMQRDPIDTCLSIYFQHFETAPSYTNDLDDLAQYYSEYLRVMSHWHSIFPADAILDVPYEGLIEDQEAWSRKLVEFVGLPWDARCIDFHRTGRTVVTASKWQVRQRISKAPVGRWRKYADFVGPLRRLLQHP
jgi:tetratricopeptide (TPR) repeat protein